jgi:hypothetical protein
VHIHPRACTNGAAKPMEEQPPKIERGEESKRCIDQR